MKFLFFIMTFCLFTTAFCYELNGSATSDGSGDYSLELQNEYGHVYSGTASDNGDGTIDVSVSDYNNETYSGIAESNGDGTYSLSLQNDTSGGSAEGQIDVDE